MKKQLFISLGLFAVGTVLAQQKIELKPSVSAPPCTYNQVNLAVGYSDANNATTDLFGKNGKSDFAIPANYMGNQDAVEGDNYFGIITYKGDKVVDFKNIGKGGISEGKPTDYKFAEYLQVAMPQSLTAGKEYEMIFKVSLADYAAYATKGFGVYFSDNKVSQKGNVQLTVTPQVTYDNLITDKAGWTELKAKFKATGSEKFAVIGCFANNFAVQKVGGGKNFGSVRAYYYISGISIVEAPKPDKDKDGIPDETDACPDIAGIEKFNGCPDSDGDGIADKDDKCPEVAGLAQFQGCADTDNDGVDDTKDKCPTVAGLASNNGCPVVKIDEKSKQIFQQAMSGIQFESGKDVIKKISFPILDNVVTVLKTNPDWNVEIQGHTDNVGNADKNKSLSANRAIAVKNYLTSKGVVNSLKSNGYGQERPMADNKTKAGKAKNRRVEFNVTYEK